MRTRWYLLAPLLLLLSAAYVLPLIWLIPQSLNSGGSFGLANYQEIAAAPVYRVVGMRTLRIAAVVALLCLVFAYPLAWQISNLRRRWLPIAAALIAVPLLSSAIVRSEAWVYLLLRNGPIATLFRLLPGKPEVVLVRTEPGVIIAMVQVLLPIALLPLIAAFFDLDRNLIAAARNLGARNVEVWRTVVLPITAPAAAGSAALTFLLALGFWITPSIVGSQRTETIAPLISEQASRVGDVGLAAALSIALLLTTLACVLIFALLARRLFAWAR